MCFYLFFWISGFFQVPASSLCSESALCPCVSVHAVSSCPSAYWLADQRRSWASIICPTRIDQLIKTHGYSSWMKRSPLCYCIFNILVTTIRRLFCTLHSSLTLPVESFRTHAEIFQFLVPKGAADLRLWLISPQDRTPPFFFWNTTISPASSLESNSDIKPQPVTRTLNILHGLLSSFPMV